MRIIIRMCSFSIFNSSFSSCSSNNNSSSNSSNRKVRKGADLAPEEKIVTVIAAIVGVIAPAVLPNREKMSLLKDVLGVVHATNFQRTVIRASAQRSSARRAARRAPRQQQKSNYFRKATTADEGLGVIIMLSVVHPLTIHLQRFQSVAKAR
jgi:hypothetical protein